jgi:hypothetical protein
VNHIGLTVSELARMLGFIKRIRREFIESYTYKTLNMAFVRPGLFGLCIMRVDLLMRFICQKLSTIQHKFRRFAPRGLGWTSQPMSTYKSRYLLLGLEVLNDRRKVAAALFSVTP